MDRFHIKNSFHSISILLLKIIILISSTMIFYWEELNVVFIEAINNEYSTHVILLPLMITYMLYQKKKVFTQIISLHDNDTRPKNSFLSNLVGFTLCIISLFIKFFGMQNFQTTAIIMLSIPIFLCGVTILLFNYDILKIFFIPICFILYLIPPPVEFIQIVGTNLSNTSSHIAYVISKYFINDLEISTPYGIPYITVLSKSGEYINFVIDISCSGIYSLIGYILFLTFFIYILKTGIIFKFFMAIFGIPLMYSLNISRIIILIAIGYYYNANLALKIFHLIGGGLVIFLGTLLLLYFLQSIFKTKIFSDDNVIDHNHLIITDHCVKCGLIDVKLNHTLKNIDAIKFFSIIVIIVAPMLFNTQVYNLTTATSQVLLDDTNLPDVLINLLPIIPDYNLDLIYRDVYYQNLTDQDAALMYKYSTNVTEKPDFWVGVSIANSIGELHAWDTCIIPSIRNGYGTQYSLHDIILLDNPTISARFFSFKEHNRRDIQVTLFWFSRSVFQTNLGYNKKWVMFSVIRTIDKPELVDETEESLIPIGQNIASYWNPMDKWSDTGLILVRMAPTIILSALSILIYFSARKIYSIYILKKRGRKISLLIDDKIDVMIINIMKNSNFVTEGEIINNYKDLYNKKISESTLSQKLDEGERLGLFERKIMIKNDNAYMGWKLR